MQFLSDEWFDALSAALATVEVPDGLGIRIGQVVTGAPGGDVSYVVECRDGGCTITRGSVDGADVVFHTAAATAVELADPETTAAAGHAVLRGDVRVSGDVTRLLAVGDLTTRLAAAISELGPPAGPNRS